MSHIDNMDEFHNAKTTLLTREELLKLEIVSISLFTFGGIRDDS